MKNTLKTAFKSGLVLVFAVLIQAAFAQSPSACPPISGEEVVSKLVRKNAERASTLPAFRSTRSYRLDYGGFGGARNSEMIVDMEFSPPSTKTFTVLSQSGSKVLNDRVIKKLIEEEKAAFEPENQRRTALNESNYGFTLQGCETTDRGSAYVLGVEPKVRSKYLYKGKIWVDAGDFAVWKIEAEPAKNPSFWVKQTKIEQKYQKVGQFWLPASNHSFSSVRLGGHANLTILYDKYQWIAASPPLRSSNTKSSE
jgi:hypothetical protein